MGNAKELAQHAAEICATALTYTGASATGVVPFLVPLTALAAIGAGQLQQQRVSCVKRAAARALAVFEATPEFARTNLDRVKLLIGDPRATIVRGNQNYWDAAQAGTEGFRLRLVAELLANVAFEPDDHLERRAVEAAYGAAVDCLLAEPDMNERLSQDLLIDMARAHGIELSLLNEIRDETVRTGRAVEELGTKLNAVGDNILKILFATSSHGEAMPAAFGITAANTIILGWRDGPTDWWGKTSQTLRVALDRLSDGLTFVPQPWDFSSIDKNDAAAIARSNPEMWQALSGAAASMHVASIVYLGDGLGQNIPVDKRLEGLLCKQGFLVEEVGAKGFFDATAVKVSVRHELIAAGAVPLTPVTRLIAETVLAGKPLLIWNGATPGGHDPELTSLLAWLEARDVKILTGNEPGEVSVWAFDFLMEIFAIEAAEIPNPYRKLDHYLQADADDYYGRDAEAEIAGRWLQSALSHPGEAFLRIGGPSGIGKSSFVNARVAPQATDAGLVFVTFRPTDFDAMAAPVFSPIREFCALLDEELGRKTDIKEFPLIDIPDRARAAAVKWVQRLHAKGTRILIGIDQFEEILDNIANDWNADAWRALLGLMSDLVQTAGCLVCFTLESSRNAIFETHLADTPFQGAKVILLEDSDDVFLRQIISQPFADVGFKLAGGVVDTLVREARQHQAEAYSGSSSLPLLSLKLHDLFSHVTRMRRRTPGSLDFEYPVRELTLDDLANYPLSIAEEIANLGEQAWNDAGGGTLDDLDPFLRPFVRIIPIEGLDGGRIVLQAVPSRSHHAIANRQAAFVKRRLIVPTIGGFRLVHEAVIRRWPLANAWFEKERDSLLRQTAFATKAAEWASAGRASIAVDEADAATIALAARMLGASASYWVTGSESDIGPAAEIERDYCLAIFAHAADPRTITEGSPYRSSYIHLAAAYGLTDLVSRFLDADPASVDLSRKDGRTPLMNAAFASPAMVSLLLERNAAPNLVDEQGLSAIESTIWGHNQEIFNMLLPHLDPTLASEERFSPLYGAAMTGQFEMLEKLERRGFQHDGPAKGGYSPLIGAAFRGDGRMFELCLAKGDPLRRTSNGLNTLDALASEGNFRLMEELIKHPAGARSLLPDPATGKTALMWAAGALKPKTVTYLRRLEVDPNAMIAAGEDVGRTALHHCLDWLHRSGARAPRFLIEQTRATLEALLVELPDCATVDVGVADAKGLTAYTMLEHHQSLRDMVAAHAKFLPSTLPPGVATPLERAIADKDRRLVEELLAQPKHIAVADRINSKHDSPAEVMIRNGWFDLVVELIEKGHVDPFQKAPPYSGLLLPAWRSGDAKLRELMLARLSPQPELIHFHQIILAKCDPRYDFAPPDFDLDDRLLEACLARRPNQEALDAGLLTAGRLGNAKLFKRLLEAGATVQLADKWGRTILARCSDAVINSAPAELHQTPAAAIPSARMTQSTNKNFSISDRAILVDSDLDAIKAVIAARDGDDLRDGWGRTPADMVADRIQAEVRDLVQMKLENPSSKGLPK